MSSWNSFWILLGLIIVNWLFSWFCGVVGMFWWKRCVLGVLWLLLWILKWFSDGFGVWIGYCVFWRKCLVWIGRYVIFWCFVVVDRYCCRWCWLWMDWKIVLNICWWLVGLWSCIEWFCWVRMISGLGRFCWVDDVVLLRGDIGCWCFWFGGLGFY